MLTTILLGIGASLLTEAISWVDKELSGTPLKGDGAFILSMVVAFAAGAIKVAYTSQSVLTVGTLGTYFAQVWAISQVFFIGIYQAANLDVSSTPSTTPQ